ncbi:serine hydrolase domain-containing protein [Microbacterium sp.]|uniref:serine hydrolase domain-containing protein n=1 Tax=Microbacterium sp. TaxID=51671 RepID=UPI0039E6DEFA
MIDGHTAPRWTPLRDAFEAVVREDDAGASLAIVHEGELVVDLWGGTDPLSGRAWERDSVTLTFSTAKGVLALLAATEIEAGRLDPGAPVARYWPEFAAEGKGAITVGDVLTHTAGLPILPLDDIDDLRDPQALADRLAASAPSYPPRSARVYHVLSYGTLVGEILRRITGEDIQTLVRRRLADPLDASLWFGLPGDAEARYLPALMGPVEFPAEPGMEGDSDAARACRAAYRANLQIMPLFVRGAGGQGSEPMNGPEFLRAQVGGGGLVAHARAIATVYGACVAETGGVRLLTDATVAEVSADHLGGIPEPVCGPGAVPTTIWGWGFELAHPACAMLGAGSFGHAGMGGRLSFASARHRLGFSFVGQRMLFPDPGTDPRWARLLGAVQHVLAP